MMSVGHSVKARISLLVLLLLTGLPAIGSAAPFTALYVFGDSLSDTGNLYLATGGTTPSAPPYYAGRFSNGPVAVERLAEDLGLTVDPSLAGGTNFAFGGARTGTGTTPPGLLTQVGMYDALPGGGDPAALYFVLAGANEVRDAANLDQAARNVVSALGLLYDMGARSFLVPNLPNLGRTPEAIALGNAAGATLLSLSFNSLLATYLDAFFVMHSDILLVQFDTYAWFEGIITNANALGYTVTTVPCLINTSVCSDPTQFVFWDGIHPTARTHQAFGDALAAAVAEPTTPVPEPATLTLLALGIGAGVLRRRHMAGR